MVMAPLMTKILGSVSVEKMLLDSLDADTILERNADLPSPTKPAIAATELHASIREYGAKSIGKNVDAVESGKAFLYFVTGVPA
jgi:hypothetical protein